jgi:hypothetical protein
MRGMLPCKDILIEEKEEGLEKVHTRNVISASRRTDVPAFHSRWFMCRLAAGFAEYRNPLNGQTYRVSLDPANVRAFVFWTRNPSPLMRYLPELSRRGTPFYFLFTLTAYPRSIERSTPTFGQAVKNFRRLASRIGPECVRWRYDPIVVSKEMNGDFHRQNFSRIARALAGATEVCIVSFLDMYGKVKRNLAALEDRTGFQREDIPPASRWALASDLAKIGAGYGIRLLACCEDGLVRGAVEKACCVDSNLLDRIAPSEERLPIRPTREECGCAASRDIGAYDTCPHGCVYCYANASPEAARRRYAKMEVNLPSL